MTTLVLRGLAERRLRSFLTGLSILLGVAMIAGTFVMTDQIRRAFDDIETTANQGNSLVVTARQAFESDISYALPPLPQSVVARVGAVDGVARAQGQLQESGSLVLAGRRVGSRYAPGIVISGLGAPFSPLRYRSGRPPGAGEISINAKLAADEHLALGRPVGVATRTGVRRVRIAGIFDYGAVSSIGGATIIVAPLAAVQRWYGEPGKVSLVVAAAAPGVTDAALARRARAALPGLQVRTGAEQASHDAGRINDSLGAFLTPLLLALAGAAVLVGAFIIFNTFSITVAERVREFALLRSLGATAGQLVAAVSAEALLIGAVASALGIAVGLGFAAAIGALFDAAGFGIPRSAPVLAIADDRRRAGGRRRRDARGRADPRAARHARAARRRAGRKRATVAAPAAMGAVAHRRRVPGRAGGAARRAVRLWPGHGTDGRDGRRRRAAVHRPGAVGALVRPPARLGDRAAGAAAVRRARPAGARERDAQSRPHGHHLGRADGRARLGRVCRGLRRRPEGVGRRQHR